MGAVPPGEKPLERVFWEESSTDSPASTRTANKWGKQQLSSRTLAATRATSKTPPTSTCSGGCTPSRRGLWVAFRLPHAGSKIPAGPQTRLWKTLIIQGQKSGKTQIWDRMIWAKMPTHKRHVTTSYSRQEIPPPEMQTFESQLFDTA